MSSDFDLISLDALRTRRSEKWAAYPPDVLPSFLGEMDFPLAPPIREVLLAAIENDDCGYPHAQDIREPFAAFAEGWFRWKVDPAAVSAASDVMVAVSEILRELLERGDGVVINPPVYPPFSWTIRAAGLEVVEVPLARDGERFVLDLDGIERAFAGGAKAFLLCNPHNPTGRSFARSELERIAELAVKYDVLVLSDEIHAPMTMFGAQHVPYLALGEELTGRSFTITGASKAFNLAGLKAAVVVTGSEALRTELKQLFWFLDDHSGHLGVLASVAAFERGREWLDDLVSYLDGNRRLLGELLASRLPGVSYALPEAGYFAWLDFRATGLGDDPAAWLRESGRVALGSGPEFGEPGKGFARLNYGTSAAIVTETVERAAAAVAGR